jgi:hypothetical protein
MEGIHVTDFRILFSQAWVTFVDYGSPRYAFGFFCSPKF